MNRHIKYSMMITYSVIMMFLMALIIRVRHSIFDILIFGFGFLIIIMIGIDKLDEWMVV